MTTAPERAPAAPPVLAAVPVPALYDAVVGHTRHLPFRRSFQHKVYSWLVDLDRLPVLPRWLAPFARFEARDHLGDPARSIRENVDAYLATRGVDLGGGQILMLANARVAGYVFNPLSVYWCHRRDGTLACVLAEVHNTYGQRHCYLLRTDDTGRSTVGKEFYVSPFFEVHGEYLMRVPRPGDKLSVTIALRQHGTTAFTATLRGDRRPATTAQVLRMVLRRPLITLRVSALISKHGITLWLRRLPVIRRPEHRAQEGVQ